MARSGNLTNKLGKKLRGSRYAYYLPEPVNIPPRDSCLDTRETRIRLALSQIALGEVISVEGVHVERIGTRKMSPYFVVNYSGVQSLDESVERICKIMDNRL